MIFPQGHTALKQRYLLFELFGFQVLTRFLYLEKELTRGAVGNLVQGQRDGTKGTGKSAGRPGSSSVSMGFRPVPCPFWASVSLILRGEGWTVSVLTSCDSVWREGN